MKLDPYTGRTMRINRVCKATQCGPISLGIHYYAQPSRKTVNVKWVTCATDRLCSNFKQRINRISGRRLPLHTTCVLQLNAYGTAVGISVGQ